MDFDLKMYFNCKAYFFFADIIWNLKILGRCVAANFSFSSAVKRLHLFQKSAPLGAKDNGFDHGGKRKEKKAFFYLETENYTCF